VNLYRRPYDLFRHFIQFHLCGLFRVIHGFGWGAHFVPSPENATPMFVPSKWALPG
jgi:hypothetical protein